MSEFEHGKLSPWGYIIDAETLPNFLTFGEFNNFTNGKFGADMRIMSNIPAATESIRNYCGWHIAPSLTCGMLYNVRDLRDAFVGPDLLVQLPSTYVTSIEKVVVNAVWNANTNDWDGDVITDYDIGMGTGLLRIYDVGALDRKSKIFIKFVSGYETAPASIKGLTADCISHSVANPYGVSSESAGGVSVSYSGVWAGMSASSSLPSETKEVLEAYRLKGVF